MALIGIPTRQVAPRSTTFAKMISVIALKIGYTTLSKSSVRNKITIRLDLELFRKKCIRAIGKDEKWLNTGNVRDKILTIVNRTESKVIKSVRKENAYDALKVVLESTNPKQHK